MYALAARAMHGPAPPHPPEFAPLYRHLEAVVQSCRRTLSKWLALTITALAITVATAPSWSPLVTSLTRTAWRVILALTLGESSVPVMDDWPVVSSLWDYFWYPVYPVLGVVTLSLTGCVAKRPGRATLTTAALLAVPYLARPIAGTVMSILAAVRGWSVLRIGATCALIDLALLLHVRPGQAHLLTAACLFLFLAIRLFRVMLCGAFILIGFLQKPYPWVFYGLALTVVAFSPSAFPLPLVFLAGWLWFMIVPGLLFMGLAYVIGSVIKSVSGVLTKATEALTLADAVRVLESRRAMEGMVVNNRTVGCWGPPRLFCPMKEVRIQENRSRADQVACQIECVAPNRTVGSPACLRNPSRRTRSALQPQ
jgi:hypothetical protein